METVPNPRKIPVYYRDEVMETQEQQHHQQQQQQIIIQTQDGEGVDGVSHVVAIDPEQIAAALAQSADGTAQIIDEEGNTITLTAEQLAAAGIIQLVEASDGIPTLEQLQQLGEGQLVTGDDGQTYYVINQEEVAPAVPDGTEPAQQQKLADSVQLHNAPVMASGTPQPVSRDGYNTRSSMMNGLSDVNRRPPPGRYPARDRSFNPYSQYSYSPPSRKDFKEQVRPAASDQYRRMLDEKDRKLRELELKLKEANEQNIIMAHALVSTCKSQEVEVVVQNPDGTTGKRQLVSVKPNGPDVAKTGMSRAPILPFQCELCPKRFTADHHLKRHVDIAHNKKRPFYCKYCAKDVYVQSDSSFQAHLRMEHQVESESGLENVPNNKQTSSAGGADVLQPRRAAISESSGALEREVSGGESTDLSQASAVDVGPDEEEPDWESQAGPKALQCDQCKEKFTLQNDLIAHKQAQHPATNATAKQQNKELPSESEEEAIYKCKYCDREFLSLPGFKRHCSTIHPNEPPQSVEKVLQPLKEQQVATAPGTEAETHTCVVCSRSFSQLDFLEKHKLAHLDEHPYNCHLCTRKFKWKENLQKHLKWHAANLPHKCDVCGKGFTNEQRLGSHKRLKHPRTVAREHACPVCNKTFYERDSLSKHMREHSDRVFPCTECDKKFIDEKFLRRHMLTHTQVRDYTCEYCGKTFGQAENLKAHRFIHSGTKPYKCEFCGNGFTTSWALKNHLQLHTAVRPHMCEHCGRSFNVKSNLDVHLRTHRGLKPFQCSSCSRTFSRLEHLKTHINAHKGIRPYPCPQCEKAFYNESALNQHLRIHSEKPFQCGTCGKSFSKRTLLSAHLETHTRQPEVQYVVIWEKAGALQEALIMTDGVAQEAAVAQSSQQATASAAQPSTVVTMPASTTEQQQHITLANVAQSAVTSQVLAAGSMAQLVETSQSMPTILDSNQIAGLLGAGAEGIRLVDEHGNPIEGLPAEGQFLILQEGASLATSVDAQTLAALQSGAVGVEGAEQIFLSEEDIRALAEQGVVVYQQ